MDESKNFLRDGAFVDPVQNSWSECGRQHKTNQRQNRFKERNVANFLAAMGREWAAAFVTHFLQRRQP
jgi:hypothetical protein